MKLLAIDTALPAVSACVIDSDIAAPLSCESAPMERGHAEALLPLLERVVAAGGGFASIERVAVTVGPGSFTGIRIGLAAGQAIALALRAPIVGVSTLAALAAPHILEPFDGVVAAAIDARHGQVYVTAYGPDGRTLLTPRRVGAHEALRALGDGPLKLVGSGAPLLAAEARASGVAAEIADARAAPDIALVARLGLAANPDTAPARPLYLKAPDAKPQGRAAAEAPAGA
ncbi:tRNA (adenosine(37)-N6)-threonylcarbamoyltransferase complex dimerization subunit type 1 TsaB [Methylosinus sp. Sm6]|uniref:tRNA (adenosine(37)-N6)-threonylcarbamoyltransferase complex dimerization subunit type 1 TsaB n=1 Tax=Methylosinus sp. Sm6 TaxID=2866948 RepID=UPI001C99AC1A|nr:tRNA (adenosine(37)-N6)-threonylcarbamoyltransferase complex dimerization subunit type 1 TsaB [Methylosinus sp. Sm6]MBY6242119.1 tRNA (adenosine(37)-N6)-threonylcarbamoyltransferase complex dimerization subunit type 1 TsaB [Methylosinus sp. Sm6]